MELKKCSCCKKELPLDVFPVYNTRVYSSCIDCKRMKGREAAKRYLAKEENKQKQKEYYTKNKTYLNDKGIEYYENNKDHCLQLRKDRYYEDVCESRTYYRDYMSEYRKTPNGREKIKNCKRKTTQKYNHKLISIRECYAGNKYSTKIIADKEKLIEEINSLLQQGMNKDNFKIDWTIREDKEGKLYTQWKRKCLE